MRYKDFILEFGPPGSDGTYPVSIRSPAGADRDFFLDPFPGGPPAGTRLEIVGEALFRALFQREVQSLYFMSLGLIAAQRDMGLRIQIQIDPTNEELISLASHPWEALFSPRLQQFLTLDPLTPIVRSLRVPRPPRNASFTKPLSILGISSNPLDLPPLDLKRERRNLRKACAQNPNVRLEFLRAPCTPEAIQAKLRKSPFQILLFMGHGEIDHEGRGCLFFQDSKSLARAVTAEELKNLIGEFKDLRFIFLNACNTAPFGAPNPFSGVAAALVLRGFPAVLAMRSAIEDEAAIKFSQTFFRVLLEESPLEVAVQAGRIAAQLTSPASDDWGLPVLFVQTQEKPSFSRRLLEVSKWAALAVPALALSFWLLWPSSGISIDVPAEGSSVPAVTDVIVHGQDRPGKHYYLLVRDPDGKCWLQGSGALNFDGGDWHGQVQLLGDTGDFYDIFIVSSPDLSLGPQRTNGSYCDLLPDGTRAVRHVTLRPAEGGYDRSQ